MEHYFNVNIAKIFGIEEAILIHNLFFWINKNKSNNTHLHDGRYWTYNTAKAFTILFPYMSESKISRVLKKLEDKGVIIRGNYNKEKFDRTSWFAFSDYGMDILSKNGYTIDVSPHFAKMKNANSQNELTIPYINTDINIKEDNDKSLSKKDDNDNDWRHNFDAYLEIVEDAKHTLVNDSEFYDTCVKYYPNADYDLTIDKMVEMYWGTEEGWNNKRKKRTKKINMVSTLKKNYPKNIVYKQRGQVGRVHDGRDMLNEQNNDKVVIDGVEYK